MSNNLQVIPYEGVPDGSMLSVPPHQIPDTAARYIQDGIIRGDAFTLMRGPVRAASGIGAELGGTRAVGIVQTIDPAGNTRVAMLSNVAAGANVELAPLNDAFSDLTFDGTQTLSDPGGAYPIVHSSPALGGGVWIGVSRQYSYLPGVTDGQSLVLWKGANKQDFDDLFGTISVARGDLQVVGSGTSFTTNASPGHFLFNASLGGLIGVVKSIETDVLLTLEEPALVTAAPSTFYSLKVLRGFNPRVTTGRITVELGATAVTGANTRFKDEMHAGAWDIYRARDKTFVGQFDSYGSGSITSNTSLTFGNPAALAMDDEAYVAIHSDGSYDEETAAVNKVGFLTAPYAGRQWYLNNAFTPERTARLYLSELLDPEAVNMTEDGGNYIPVSTGTQGTVNTPGTGIATTFNSLLVLKENETFAVLGSTEAQFTLKKLSDDGCLSAMGVQQYEGGAIFPGRNGLFFCDGQSAPVNISEERLGEHYRKLVKDFDPSAHRMWSMLHQNHYFLHIEAVGDAYKVRKGAVATTITRTTLCLNLATKAYTFLTNLDIRGAAVLPSDSGEGVWFVVTAEGAEFPGTVESWICRASDLFDAVGPDELTCEDNTPGPDFYLETKRYDMGDPLWKKTFKRFLMHYHSNGGTLSMDTVLGLNETGTTTATPWPETATSDAMTFEVKRKKFLKRDRMIGFRIYKTDSDVTQVRIGPWAIGMKPQRLGRI